jgi:hypothetical protein
MMNQLRMDQQEARRQLDARAGERTAREFLRQSLAWERRLATLRNECAGTACADAEPGAAHDRAAA